MKERHTNKLKQDYKSVLSERGQEVGIVLVVIHTIVHPIAI